MTMDRHGDVAARPSFGQLLRSPRLWIWTILSAIGLGLYRYGLDRAWPMAEADLGWLGFQAVGIGGGILIYLALALILRPFQVR